MTKPISTRRRVLAPLVYLAALVLLLEDWCWDAGSRVAAALGAWPPLRAFEQRLRALPPYVALAAFVLPGLLLFPVKVLAVVAITHGHAVSGIATLVAAKLGGAAVIARLYVLTLPSLLAIAWFARCHAWFLALKERCFAYVRASRAFIHVRRAARLARRMLRRVLRRLAARAPFGRRRGSRQARVLRRFVVLVRARRSSAHDGLVGSARRWHDGGNKDQSGNADGAASSRTHE